MMTLKINTSPVCDTEVGRVQSVVLLRTTTDLTLLLNLGGREETGRKNYEP